MEALVDASNSVDHDNEKFEDEDHDVIPWAGEIVWGSSKAGRGVHPFDSGEVKGFGSSEQTADDKDHYLGIEGARAELGQGIVPGEDGRDSDEEKGQNRNKGEESEAVDAQAAIDVTDIPFQAVMLLDDAGDEHAPGDEHAEVDGQEDEGHDDAGAVTRMLGSDDAASEGEVDDVQEHDAAVDRCEAGDVEAAISASQSAGYAN
jgi:hypothetical protein